MEQIKRHTIRFSQEAYMYLIVLAAEASTERGQPVSMNELVNELIIEKFKNKGMTDEQEK